MNGSTLKVQATEGTASFCELYNVQDEQQDQNVIDEALIAYQAARLAGLRTTASGYPIINSLADYQNYMRFYNLAHQKVGSSLEVVNYDGSTTVYYVCAMPYSEAVNIQWKLDEKSQAQVYGNDGWTTAEKKTFSMPCCPAII